MAFNFSDKIVVLTGASSGIGAEMAIQMAEKGAIVVGAARSEDALKSVISKCQKFSKRSTYFTLDVQDEERCKELISWTVEQFGRIDVLVNNAGISMRALVQDSDVEVLKKVMEVNFWGAVYLTKNAMPYLQESQGIIVGVSSVSGFMSLPGRVAYNASKAALNSFLETVKLENLYTGVHVLLACPGFTESNIRKSALNGKGEKQAESPRDEKRMMPTSDAARAIVEAIEKRSHKIIMTTQGKLIYRLQRLIPRFIERKVYEDFEKEPGSPLKGLRK